MVLGGRKRGRKDNRERYKKEFHWGTFQVSGEIWDTDKMFRRQGKRWGRIGKEAEGRVIPCLERGITGKPEIGANVWEAGKSVRYCESIGGL